MNVRPLVMIGGGGHAKVVTSMIKKLPQYTVSGYVDIEDHGAILGAPYLGTDDVLPSFLQQHPTAGAVLGMGYLGKGGLREGLTKKIEAFGYSFPPIISPDAVVNEEVEVGEGTVIVDGVVVNTGTQIGRYVIVNTSASIDHDCVIGDFTHIAPGVTLSGGVRIGARSLIGTGAAVVQYTTVGERCIVGSGAVVTKDCMEHGTYVGVPARRKI